MKMKTTKISMDWCAADLPEGWHCDLDASPTLIEGPERRGALRIRVAVNGTPIEDSDLRDFAHEHLEAGASAEPYGNGSLHGFTFAFGCGGMYWRHWYLYSGHVMFFVTYTCRAEERDVEAEAVEAIVASVVPTMGPASDRARS